MAPTDNSSPEISSPDRSSPEALSPETITPETSAYLTKSELGRRGEELAAAYLQQCGYRLVAANFTVPVGQNRKGADINVEIDLIAYDDATLCFIEVKTRASDWFAVPSVSVDLRKQRQITRGARAYRRLFGLTGARYRYDVVSIVLPPEEARGDGTAARCRDGISTKKSVVIKESGFKLESVEKIEGVEEVGTVEKIAGVEDVAGIKGVGGTRDRDGVKIELLRNFWTEEKFRKRRWQERYWD